MFTTVTQKLPATFDLLGFTYHYSIRLLYTMIDTYPNTKSKSNANVTEITLLLLRKYKASIYIWHVGMPNNLFLIEALDS